MRIIGDVHGKIDDYLKIIGFTDCSLQLGDMGFDYSRIPESADHRFIRGNHDNYDSNHPNILSDYGIWRDIFYIRGAYSIDKIYRREGVDWFRNEELSYQDANDTFDFYEKVKPRIVVTHSAPMRIVGEMGFKPLKTFTQSLLDTCFEAHQPELWIFGHFHKSWVRDICGTRFRCLAELETFDFASE